MSINMAEKKYISIWEYSYGNVTGNQQLLFDLFGVTELDVVC